MSVARDTVAGLAVRRHADDSLVDRALGGDPVAFSELHRRYSGRVFAFCLARLMSIEAAQDATQEVFLRLLSADAEQVRSISGWLFGVARNVCIDTARARQRTAPSEAGAIEAALDTHRSGDSAEDEALTQAEAGTVFLALRRMRPRYRTTLVMKELHGQSIAEIAEALSINVGAAYTLLSRARDAFGKAYSATLQLPAPCHRAVELVYRTTGSGISAAESVALEQHLTQCDSCRREARRATGKTLFSGLLPLLPLQWGASGGLIAAALRTLGGAVPMLSSAAAAPSPSQSVPALTSVIVAVSVAVGLAAVPAGVEMRAMRVEHSAEMNRAAVAAASRAAAAHNLQASESAAGASEELRLTRQERRSSRMEVAVHAQGAGGFSANSGVSRMTASKRVVSVASGGLDKPTDSVTRKADGGTTSRGTTPVSVAPVTRSSGGTAGASGGTGATLTGVGVKGQEQEAMAKR